MGALASHEAQRLAFQSVPSSESKPGVYGAAGLLIAYFTVLTYGVIENFSVETFEGTMNIAAIAGFVVFYAAFRPSGDRYGTDAENEQLRRDLRHPVNQRSKKAGALDRWGPHHIIGFLND